MYNWSLISFVVITVVVVLKAMFQTLLVSYFYFRIANLLDVLMASSKQTLPAGAFISRSTDLLHLSFGRPLLLFPAEVQRVATLIIHVGGILLTWPIHLHLLYFTSNDIGRFHSWSSAVVILFGQNMCRILLRHLFLEYFQHVAYSFSHFPRLSSI